MSAFRSLAVVEEDTPRWPFPYRPRLQFWFCSWRGHRFVSLRWDQEKVDNLGHLHRYAGYDAQCRTCGVKWEDSERTNFNERNSVRPDGWKYKAVGRLEFLAMAYNYVPWRNGENVDEVVELYVDDIRNRVNSEPKLRGKKLLHAPRIKWWQLWRQLRAWWFVRQHSSGLSRFEMDFYEKDNFKQIVRYFLNRKHLGQRKRQLKKSRHPRHRRSLGPRSSVASKKDERQEEFERRLRQHNWTGL
jgi:hypothetical protein